MHFRKITKAGPGNFIPSAVSVSASHKSEFYVSIMDAARGGAEGVAGFKSHF